MARSPQEIFKRHAEALTAGDGIRAQTVRFTPEPVG
jgi:hypothetical protein